MFKMKITVNQKRLANLRALPEHARLGLKTKMQTELKPELQTDVETLLGEPPASVFDPFTFQTRNSKLYYLILIRENPELADDQHWIRTGDIPGAFEVRISSQFKVDLITISNTRVASTGTKPYPARWVYKWAPPGHMDTGWPEQARRARRFLQLKSRRRIYKLYRQALREAAKGKG